MKTAYHDTLLDPKLLGRTADKICDGLRDAELHTVPIAVRGVSGLVMGGVVSSRLQVPLVVVRKKEEKAHSLLPVEGPEMIDSGYIVLDDFISSGRTILEIVHAVDMAYTDPTLCGIMEYSRPRNIMLSIPGGPCHHVGRQAMLVPQLLGTRPVDEIRDEWLQHYDADIPESEME